MYDHRIKQCVRRPRVEPVTAPNGLNRVRITVAKRTYDLELEEAMVFANRLVDAAERFTNET